MPPLSKLKILEEIGLISIGDDFETTEFTNEKVISFRISINEQQIILFLLYKKIMNTIKLYGQAA